MTAEDLPGATLRFLRERVCSASRLEVLLAFYRNPGRWQSSDALAQQISMSPELVTDNLEQLCAAGILDVRLAENVVYRASEDPTVTQLMAEAAQAFYRDRDGVLAVLMPRSHGARLFAGAFDLRKGKPK